MWFPWHKCSWCYAINLKSLDADLRRDEQGWVVLDLQANSHVPPSPALSGSWGPTPPLLSCHWHWIGIPKKEGITRGREQRCYQTSNSVFQMRELSKRGSLQGHEESHTFPSVTQPLKCRYEIWPKGFPGPGVLAHFIISCCFSPLALSVQSFHPFIRKELFQREQHLYWQWEIGGEMLMAT